jgi:outer membrane protein TolC
MKYKIILRSCILTLCIIHCSLFICNAQEIFSLEKCKEMALANNAKAQNAQLAIEAAQQTEKEAFTKYFPSVSATGMGFNATEGMISLPSEQGPIGMLEKGIIGSVMAAQPVFAGGQIVNGNKLAKIGEAANLLQKSMTDSELLLTVEQCYWQIVAMTEKTKTIAEAETLLNRALQDVKNACDAGLANKNDLLKVELKQHELESGKLKLTNGLKLAKMALAQLAGAPVDGFEIETTLTENETLSPNVRADHQTALLQRDEYLLLDKSIEAARLQVRMEIGKNLPTVAVGAGWNYMSLDKGSPMASKNGFGMGFASVSVPLSGWWGGSHAVKKQRIQVQIAENNKRNAEEMLLLQMQQLWNELEEATLQIQLSEKTIVAALENVRLNDDYYKAGTSLLTDLLDAQNTLQQARDQHTEAITVYRVKLAKYRQATE